MFIFEITKPKVDVLNHHLLTNIVVKVSSKSGDFAQRLDMGHYNIGDLRDLPSKVAAKDMLGWSLYGSVYGSAYGVEGSINASVGFKNEPFSQKTWLTGGLSSGIGGGTLVGGYIGLSKSFPAFDSQFK